MTNRTVPFAAFLLALVLPACRQVPEQTTLPDEKIARIMADLCMAEAATKGLAGYPKDSLMHLYFEQVFEMHRVQKNTYEHDLNLLARDLPHMEAVVEQAEKILKAVKEKEE